MGIGVHGGAVEVASAIATSVITMSIKGERVLSAGDELEPQMATDALFFYMTGIDPCALKKMKNIIE